MKGVGGLDVGETRIPGYERDRAMAYERKQSLDMCVVDPVREQTYKSPI